MNQQFLTFQKFNNIESAKAMADFLLSNDIPYEIDDERNYYDVSYSFNKFEFDIKLKIASSDFEKANAALEKYYTQELDNVEADYYLLQFTNDELLEVIHKPDEWGTFDYLLAQKILGNKQIDINNSNELKDKRIEEIAKPQKSPAIWIAFGYLCAIAYNFIPIYSLFVVGAALSIGVTLVFLTKTLPNGNSVHFFNSSARKNGKIILFITCVSMLCWIIYLWFWRYI